MSGSTQYTYVLNPSVGVSLADGGASVLSIEAAKEGTNFGFYSRAEEKDSREDVFLSIVDNFVCRGEDKQQWIDFQDITSLYVGKATDVFQSDVASDASDGCCLTVLCADEEFNLEADSEAIAAQWVAAINGLMAGLGNQVINAGEVTSAVDAENATGEDGVLEAALDDEDDEDVTENTEEELTEHDGAQGSDNDLRTITAGSEFSLLTSSEGVQDAFVFYKPNEEFIGTFYWCAVGERVEEEERALHMTELTDVCMGKQTPGFDSEEGKQADSTCCFSIVSSTRTFDLVAPDESVVSAWVQGINAALASAGGSMELDDAVAEDAGEDEEEDSKTEIKDNNARSFAVNPDPVNAANEAADVEALETIEHEAGELETADESAAAESKIDEDEGNEEAEDVFEDLPLTPSLTDTAGLVEMMSSGREFTRFLPDRTERIALFINEDTLYWCEPGFQIFDSERSVALRKLTDIFVQQRVDAFRTPVGKHVDISRAFCLVSKSVSLNLEALTKDQVMAWVTGIQHVVSQMGKKVIKNEDTGKSKKGRRFSVMAGDGAKSEASSDPADPLVKGATFKTYARARGDIVERDLLIKLEGLEQGSPYFATNDGRTIYLKSLCDIYVGKQTDVLKVGAKEAKTSNCMSWAWNAGNSQLHLEAPDKSVIKAWVAGIQHVVMKTSKRVVSNQKQKGVGRRVSVMESSAVRKDAPITKSMTSKASVQMMRRGRSCHLFSKNRSGLVRRVGATLCFADNVLYWYSGHSNVRDDSRTLPVKSITDIIVGKSSKVFKSHVAGTAAAKCCMSIVGKNDVSFDIQFQTSQEVVAWIRGLQAILRGAKMTVEGEGTQGKPASGGAAAASSSSDDASLSTLERYGRAKRYSVMQQTDQQKRLNPLTSLRRGETFTRYFVDAKKPTETLSEEVLLFCDVEKRVFFWCHGKKKTRVKGQELPLSDVTDIWVGKQTAELQQQKDVPRRNCFSIVGRSAALHLYAKDKNCVNRWLKGIEKLLNNDGRDVKVEETAKKTKSRRFTVVAKDALRSQPPIYQVLEGESSVDMLTRGRVAKRFAVGANGAVTGTLETVWLNAKNATFNWSPKGKTSSPAGTIDFKAVTDVYLGKKSVELKSDAAKNVDRRSALCIVAGEQSLSLELTNSMELQSWIEAIQYVMQNGGKVLQKQAEQASKTSRRFSVMPSRGIGTQSRVADALSEDESLRLMRAGRNVTIFERTSEGVVKKDVFMFYSMSNRAFFWSNSIDSKETEHSFSLAKLTDIFMGKRTHELKSVVAASANKACCWSLVGKSSGVSRLNMAMETPAERKNWLTGIQYIIKNDGRKVGEAKSSASRKKQSGPRRFSVMPSTRAIEKKVESVPAADECVELMRKGFNCTTYDRARNGVTGKTDSVLFYSSQDNSICWCDAGSDRVKLSNQSVDVSQISDIYLGKQTQAFKSEVAKSARTKRCMSVESKSGTLLNAEFAASNITQIWLAGITFLLKNLEGKRVQTAKTEVSSTVRRYSVMTRATSGQQAITLSMPAEEAIRTVMRPGREVVVYHKDNTTETVRLLYRQTSRTLHWSRVGQREDEEKTIPLDTITDIFVGKTSPEFKMPAADKVASVCCISIVAKEAQIHFACETTAEVNCWIKGLKMAIVGGGKAVHENEKVAKKASRRYSIQAGATLKQKQIKKVLKDKEALQFIRDGRVVNSYEKDVRRGFRKHRLFVYYSTGTKCFYWCPPGERTQTAECTLPLQHITDLFLGKQTVHLKSEAAREAKRENCFSLHSKTLGLHLELDSAAEMESFVEGVRQAIGAMRVAKDPNRGPDERRYSVLKKARSTSTTAPVTRVLPVERALDLMRAGRDCMLFEMVDGNVETRAICLFYRDGMFYWSVPGVAQRVHGTKHMPMSSVSDVFIGKKNRPVFESAAASEIKGNQCLTLKGLKSELSVAFNSKLELRAWLDGIRHILSAGGQKVIEDKIADKSDSRRRFSVLAAQHAKKKSNPESAVRSMRNGHNFIWYKPTDQGEMKKNRIFVFYDSSEEASGKIYWCARGKREMENHRSMGIKQITDIFLGKSTKNAKAAVKAEANCVMSVLAKGGLALDLEAERKEVVKTWLRGLQFLVSSGGKSFFAADSSANLQSANRRFSVLASLGVKKEKSDAPVSESVEKQNEQKMEGLRHGEYFHVLAHNSLLECTVYLRSGAIQCCLSNETPANASYRISLRTLTDIMLGKLSEGFRGSAQVDQFEKNRCITFKSKAGELNLIAASKNQVTDWVAGIKHALSAFTKREMFVAGGGDASSSSKGKAASAGRRYSVMSKVGLTTEKKAANVSMQASVGMLVEGLNMTSYGNSANPVKSRVHVFYDPAAGKKGTVYWCVEGKRTQDNALPLKELTDIYLGNQTDIFQHAIAANADRRACISLIGKNVALNVEADSPDDMNVFLNMVTTCLASKGRRCVMAKNESKNTGVRRFSVMPTRLPGDLPMQTGRAVLTAAAQAPNSLVSQNADDALEVMERGRRFFIYYEAGAGVFEKKEVTLFYVRKDGPSGTLYFSPPGKRIKDPHAAIPLHRISDIFLGKQTEAFKSVAATRADKKNCFSLTTDQIEVNFESPSQSQMAYFLFGISHSMVSKQSAQMVTTKKKKQEEAANSLDLSAMGAIVEEDDEVNDADNQQSAASSISESNSSKPAVRYAPVVERMIQGCVFTRYVENQDEGDDFTQVVTVSYVPGTDDEDMGFLTVAADDDTIETISLDHIVHLGQNSPIWDLHFAAAADQDCCFSIVLEDGSSVDLEAKEAHVMEDYMEAIAEIFAGNMTLDEVAEEEPEVVQGGDRKKATGRRFSVMPKSAPSSDQDGDDPVSKYLNLGNFIASQLSLDAIDISDDDKFYTLLENVTANAAAVVKRLTSLKRRSK